MNGTRLKMVEPQRGSTKCGVAKKQSFLAGRHPSAIAKPYGRVGGAIRAAGASPIFPTLALLLTPSAAFAETCDKIRPGWTPGTPTPAWLEAAYLFTTLPALVLLAASAIVLRTRSQWGALAVVVLWSCLVAFMTFASEYTHGSLAIAEGCIGSPTLFIGAVTAICIAMILYTMPRETRL